jgi:hypothetical protein
MKESDKERKTDKEKHAKNRNSAQHSERIVEAAMRTGTADRGWA